MKTTDPYCARCDSLEFEDLCVCGHPWAVHRSGHPHNCLNLIARNSLDHRPCPSACAAFVLHNPFGEMLRDLKSGEAG